MPKIGDYIYQRRMHLHMSQTELAKKMGYKNRTSICKIESGDREVPIGKVKDFAIALDCTPAYLMGWEESNNIPLEGSVPVEKNKMPVLGEVACGTPRYVGEERAFFIDAGKRIEADFCLIAHGDSMEEARIYDGDTIFIRKQSSVDNGDIAVVLVNHEATLKKVYYYKEEQKLVLQPCNSKYPPMCYAGSELMDIQILGKAVGFFSTNI